MGLHLNAPVNDCWAFVARADVGGFSIGSEFAWQAAAYLSWHVSSNLNALFGYRIFDVDYKTGAGVWRLELDKRQSGPGIGVSFTF